MPRMARRKSETGIYHIMLRGINRQQIFLDKEDNLHFLKILQDCREISQYRIFAYCLMGNHVHLLLQFMQEPPEQVMKRIGVRFVTWYNEKYARSGHLFQDRYRSEAVEDEAYFLTVLRYILRNPVKAGICSSIGEYPFSSAGSYLTGTGFTDCSFAESIGGRDSLLAFLQMPQDDTCMDDSPARLSEPEIRKLIQKIAETGDVPAEILVPRLRSAGLSMRQISKYTGISLGIVRKY